MTNTSVRAAAEGMPSINRRTLLARLAVAPALAVPATVVFAETGEKSRQPAETPAERVARLEAELIEAKKAQYPDVTDWRICRPENAGACVGTFFVMGYGPEAQS